MTEASPLHFRKMNGLGNDFVVFDARKRSLAMDEAKARAIADRRTGIGCDQLIVLEPPADPAADVFMRIYNPDASEAGACGNATRCIADTLMREVGRDRAVVQTIAGLLPAERVAGGLVKVDMGPARLGWRDVPLARDCDTLHVEAGAGALRDPACCSRATRTPRSSSPTRTPSTSRPSARASNAIPPSPSA